MIEIKEEGPPKAPRQQIVIDGDVVGEVWRMSLGYQCQLVPKNLRLSAMSLNGVGNTPMTAIIKAVINARENARLLNAAADFVEKAVEEHRHANL